MSRVFVVFVNILIFALLAILVTGIDYRLSYIGEGLALILGGVIWGLGHLLVEPLIKFFKFPINMWSLLVVSFLINVLILLIFSTALFPQLIIIKAGTFGANLNPLPIPTISLLTPLMTSLFTALLGALLQLLFRKLAK